MSVPAQFQIQRTGWAKPLLTLLGATASRSRVTVDDASVIARFSWYRIEIPFEAITAVGRERWPWYAGIGWRTNFRSIIGLIGSYEGVIGIAADPPIPTRLLGIRFRASQLYLSVGDPDGFRQAIERRMKRER